MEIVVLAGGTSTERDVSIVTATGVCKALREAGHKANVIDVFWGTDRYAESAVFFSDNNDLDKLKEKLHALTEKVPEELKRRKQEKGQFFGDNVIDFCKKADIVFMGLHGENGENGKVQATFDLMGIKYTGPGFLSSAISMDKDLTKKILVPYGVPMPKGIVLERSTVTEEQKRKAPIPCVVKPACGGSSVGVSIVNTEEEFEEALKESFKYEEKVVVEEYVKGREFSVGVIAGKALPVIEIIPEGGVYDYEHKYDPNGAKEVCPADLSDEVADKMKRYAELACEAVGIDTISRVDELLDADGNIFCLEINTLPGMTPTSLLPQEAAVLGLSYTDLCEKIVEVSLNRSCETNKF